LRGYFFATCSAAGSVPSALKRSFPKEDPDEWTPDDERALCTVKKRNAGMKKDSRWLPLPTVREKIKLENYKKGTSLLVRLLLSCHVN
jgi:hypothetical protein